MSENVGVISFFKIMNELTVLVYDCNHNLMRALIAAAKDEIVYTGNMTQIKKFAKKCRQSNLLQNEVINAQISAGLDTNCVLVMTKHCPTRYISELTTIHRFLQLLIFCLDALFTRYDDILDTETKFKLGILYDHFANVHALKFYVFMDQIYDFMNIAVKIFNKRDLNIIH